MSTFIRKATTNCLYQDCVSKEVRALAKHHLEILEHKFPHYKHTLVDIGGYSVCWICVREEGFLIFEISFMSSSIKIRPSWMHVAHSTDIVVDYADPEFTDNIISYVIEKRPRRYT